MKDERREFTRYITQKNEVQVFSNDQKIDGTLKDISKGGLAFQYTPIAGEKMDTNSINILVKGPYRFYLFDIACRIIYDISTLEEGRSFKGTERRQRGIKFVELKENQQNKLELMLKNYTIQSFDNSHWERIFFSVKQDINHHNGK